MHNKGMDYIKIQFLVKPIKFLLSLSTPIINWFATSCPEVPPKFITSRLLFNNWFLFSLLMINCHFCFCFSERNSNIVGYAIYKLPFGYLEDIGEADGDDHWLKITEHKPETIEKKLRKVERYIKRNENKEEAKDIRMYQKWKKESKIK